MALSKDFKISEILKEGAAPLGFHWVRRKGFKPYLRRNNRSKSQTVREGAALRDKSAKGQAFLEGKKEMKVDKEKLKRLDNPGDGLLTGDMAHEAKELRRKLGRYNVPPGKRRVSRRNESNAEKLARNIASVRRRQTRRR